MCIWIAAAAGCAGHSSGLPAASGQNIAPAAATGHETALPAEDVSSESGDWEPVGTDPASDPLSAEGEPVYCRAAVELQGGSGKASVDSPCPVYERDGAYCALITWSSSHYDYMVVNGQKILPVNTEGNSQFEIPLQSPEDCTIELQADTTAMSAPHLIDYTLTFRFGDMQEETAQIRETDGGRSEEETHAAAGALGKETAGSGKETQSGSGEETQSGSGGTAAAPEIPGLKYISADENEYAQCFAIYRFEGGYSLLSVDDGRSYLIAPEGGSIPDAAGLNLIVLQQPLDRIYLAASAAMCQFDEIGAVQNVILSGLNKDDWYIEAAAKAMEEGNLEYGGKYSAPDYEKIVASGVDLAVESTMILHTPKVQEKLEKLGIPVLIDRSSYESEPLGRAEWVKVYGLLTGQEEEAAQAFARQKGYVEAISTKATNKTVAIFSINSTRQVVTRSPGDYLGKIVQAAGGELCTPATDMSRATQTVSVEAFYAAAQNADILIYNASIEDEPDSLQKMCAKDNILTQFKAVEEGNVWCMRSCLYQNASRTGAVIRDLNAVVSGEAGDETEFFYRLK